MWIEVSTTAEGRHGPVRAAPRRGAPHHALTLGGAFADARMVRCACDRNDGIATIFPFARGQEHVLIRC